MSLGIECLLCDDEALARDMAVQLDQLNQDRKAIEQGMQREALAHASRIAEEPAESARSNADRWNDMASYTSTLLRRSPTPVADAMMVPML